MERIKLFDKTFKTFIPYEKIEKAIDTVADCPALRAQRIHHVHCRTHEKAQVQL